MIETPKVRTPLSFICIWLLIMTMDFQGIWKIAIIQKNENKKFKVNKGNRKIVITTWTNSKSGEIESEEEDKSNLCLMEKGDLERLSKS